MPDAFFQKKRKRLSAGPSTSRGPTKNKKRSAPQDSDSGAEGVNDMDLSHRYDKSADSGEEAEAAETAAEARVRLARMYLEGLTAGKDLDGADAAQADRENIASRLQRDVLEQSGKLHLFLANRIAPPNTVLGTSGHRLSVTAATVSGDASSLFTAGKDGWIIRWRLRDGKMERVLPKRAKVLDEDGRPLPPIKAKKSKTSGAARRRERYTKAKDKARALEGANPDKAGLYLPVGDNEGHTDEVWSLSLSSDGKYLASGGKDKRIGIWSLASGESWVKALGGHKDSISDLSFRPGSTELYTASFDRTLKLFDVSQLSYIETLFGHQEAILSMSCLKAETAISAGGRDRTCRFWKVRDESQLVFRAGGKSKLRQVLEGGDLLKEGNKKKGDLDIVEGSVDVVTMIDDQNFLSGGDSGTISLWNLGKKKPVFSLAAAHGVQEVTSETEGIIPTPRWITSLACLPYGDLFASGSWDGNIRLWALSASLRSFKQIYTIPAIGFVNSLQLILPPNNDAIHPSEWKNHKDDTSSVTLSDEETSLVAPILVASTGKEPKFGRWFKVKEAKNGAIVVPLSFC